MEIKDYIGIIEKTAVYPQEVSGFGICYTFLGILGEMGEFVEKSRFIDFENPEEVTRDLLKEAGDVLWYVTAMSLEAKLDTEGILNTPEEFFFSKGYTEHDIVAEMLKKLYRDSKELNLEILDNFLRSIVSEIRVQINNDYMFSKVLEMNYNKLIKRRETNTLHGDGDNREDA